MSQALKITSRTTKGDLVAHAKENLGVELNPEDGRDDLIKAVQEAEKSIGIVSEPETKDSDSDDGDKGDKGGKEKKGNPKKAKILIHQPPSQNPDDDDAEEETHCVVGFNGKNFQIQYDEEVVVPWGVYDVLNNAVNTRYKKEKVQGHDKKVLVPYQRKRYSVQLIDEIY